MVAARMATALSGIAPKFMVTKFGHQRPKTIDEAAREAGVAELTVTMAKSIIRDGNYYLRLLVDGGDQQRPIAGGIFQAGVPLADLLLSDAGFFLGVILGMSCTPISVQLCASMQSWRDIPPPPLHK